MTPLTDLFLTSSGRAGRIAFVLGGGVLLGLWAGFDLSAPLVLRDWIGWAIAALLLYSGACVLSQRLHDRGRSGWWSGPILLAVAMCLLLVRHAFRTMTEEGSRLAAMSPVWSNQ